MLPIVKGLVWYVVFFNGGIITKHLFSIRNSFGIAREQLLVSGGTTFDMEEKRAHFVKTAPLKPGIFALATLGTQSTVVGMTRSSQSQLKIEAIEGFILI
mmetsp:Transcript_20827/g.23342  ORF Transcript_20827/g.23342 Transcript_20827/m.23342 type:complete len:100 (+) Transcript_20827:67-366(+)